MHNVINNYIFFVFMLLNSERGVAGNLMSQRHSIIMNTVHVDMSLAFCGNEMLFFVQVSSL